MWRPARTLRSIRANEDHPAGVLATGDEIRKTFANGHHEISGFLAELETTNNGSGIVLDDPVSSLDHHYRLRVARRLLAAAKQRQVIVAGGGPTGGRADRD